MGVGWGGVVGGTGVMELRALCQPRPQGSHAEGPGDEVELMYEKNAFRNIIKLTAPIHLRL